MELSFLWAERILFPERQHWKGLGMAQPGVGVAALTDRLCGHAKRVHGVCGSSVLKGLFSNGRKQPAWRDCGKNFGDGRDWFGARPRGKRQICGGYCRRLSPNLVDSLDFCYGFLMNLWQISYIFIMEWGGIARKTLLNLSYICYGFTVDLF